jgi:REP element-mobilizing transposase RayT
MPRRKKPVQLELHLPTWGGARAGAGRKRSPRSGVGHLRRPSLDGRTPLHLTLRVARGVPNLRAERCIAALRGAFREGKERFGFRLVQYAVQSDHVHLIVEAHDKRGLSAGAQGLSIRIARGLNRALGRRGRVFGDRYHARKLGTPREVRRALAYVLLQERRHRAKRGTGMTSALDSRSSAPLFDGFARGEPRAGPWTGTVVEAKMWLLTTGWRRHGLIDPAEVPGGRTYP